jgi:hypothetical protein
MILPRFRAIVRRFIARHIIGDDPNSELSKLDRMDGRF